MVDSVVGSTDPCIWACESSVAGAAPSGGPTRRVQIYNASDNFSADANKLQTYPKSLKNGIGP